MPHRISSLLTPTDCLPMRSAVALVVASIGYSRPLILAASYLVPREHQTPPRLKAWGRSGGGERGPHHASVRHWCCTESFSAVPQKILVQPTSPKKYKTWKPVANRRCLKPN